jgi:hypothetical protein
MTDDRLSDLLDLWAEWMREQAPPRGYARRSLVVAGRYSVGTDFDEMCEDMDESHCRAVDAAVDSLPMNEKIAVYHVKLQQVWKLPRLSLDDLYVSACEILKVRLSDRGIV